MKIAVVTGASSGLGREFVRLIHQRYRDVSQIWVVARRKDRLEPLVAQMGPKIVVKDGDLTDPRFVDRLFADLSAAGRPVRLLVNAAGFGKLGEFIHLGEQEQLDMIRLNALALTQLCRRAVPLMERGSRIINIASVAGFMPQPLFAVYGGTKAYVISFSRALNAELFPAGISVTAVCPKPMKTEFFDVAGGIHRSGVLQLVGMESPRRVASHALLWSRLRLDLAVSSVVGVLLLVVSRLVIHPLVLTVEGAVELIYRHKTGADGK